MTQPKLLAKYWQSKSSRSQLAIAILLTLGAVLSLLSSSRGLAFVVIVIADLFLLFLMGAGAIRGDGHIPADDYMPFRLPCLIAFVSIFLAIVLSFAEVYRNSNFSPTGLPNYVACGPTEGCVFKPEERRSITLEDKTTAVYFSTVTITTLGYGDYTPAPGAARLFVMWELGTGFLLLLVAFPLLISRIATWKDMAEVCAYKPADTTPTLLSSGPGQKAK
jgi:hypothetical protein